MSLHRALTPYTVCDTFPYMAKALDPALKEQAKALILAGKSHSETAQLLGLLEGTVSIWVRRGKWTPMAKAVQATVSRAMTDFVREQLQDCSLNALRDVSGALQAQAKVIASESNKRLTLGKLRNTPAREGLASVTAKVVDSGVKLFAWGKDGSPSGLVGYARVSESFIDVSSVESTEAQSIEPKQVLDTPKPDA